MSERTKKVTGAELTVAHCYVIMENTLGFARVFYDAKA